MIKCELKIHLDLEKLDKWLLRNRINPWLYILLQISIINLQWISPCGWKWRHDSSAAVIGLCSRSLSSSDYSHFLPFTSLTLPSCTYCNGCAWWCCVITEQLEDSGLGGCLTAKRLGVWFQLFDFRQEVNPGVLESTPKHKAGLAGVSDGSNPIFF